METERSLEEIKNNLLPIIPESEKCRVIKYEYVEDFETGYTSLTLSIRTATDVTKLLFSTVYLNGAAITPLRDASGIYIIDTSFLGWDKKQKIEVGDWDGGPPIFWSEKVAKL